MLRGATQSVPGSAVLGAGFPVPWFRVQPDIEQRVTLFAIEQTALVSVGHYGHALAFHKGISMKSNRVVSIAVCGFVPFLVGFAFVAASTRTGFAQSPLLVARPLPDAGFAQNPLLVARPLPDAWFAPSNPRFGTWTLNSAKSSDSSQSLPTRETQTEEPSGDEVTSTIEGSAGDGSRISYTFTASYYDGKDNPMIGVGIPNGADTLALKGIDDHTFETTLKRAGKVVLTTRQVISQDGMMLTVTTKGTSQGGQATSSVLVYDKQ
jgi:hypothetical protein